MCSIVENSTQKKRTQTNPLKWMCPPPESFRDEPGPYIAIYQGVRLPEIILIESSG